MTSNSIPVNPKILEWARNNANMSVQLAAQKAHVNELKGKGESIEITATERLLSWEKGESTPSFTQLKNLAKAYRRPVLTFFLQNPPECETKLHDFRTVRGQGIDINNPEFAALTRHVEMIHRSLQDILDKSNTQQLEFVGGTRPDIDYRQFAEIIRKFLNYSIEQQLKARDPSSLFADIRKAIEEKGVFVLRIGNLGSHHSNISPLVFRGLALSDKIAPMIVVNANDSQTARLFTLIHELCHIFIGESGISNWNSIDSQLQENQLSNEILCDRTAAEFLVPEIEFKEALSQIPPSLKTEDSIELLSHRFNVSRLVILRRLKDLGLIQITKYWQIFETLKDIKSSSAKESEEELDTHNLISYRIRTRSKLGQKLVSTILDAVRDGRISELDASHIMSVKIDKFIKIA
ncbi:protein of unknown function DUF955 [Dehalogenimonas lykanthroporepellens BL-DC-9]|nr:protein of unknown function DUF955 [Dehalogenimonas lykanthroporepellens BL-DC-9]